MTIDNVIEMFPTTPYLFVGSGMTRRYFGLPSWEELLRHFAEVISKDEFAYNAYVSRAKEIEATDIMPEIATLIQKDYDDKWYRDSSIRTSNAQALSCVKNGVSPFKVEISEYLKSLSLIDERYRGEIELLKEISAKSISGVITTNYDVFLENTIPSFKRYIGQKQLIFSAIQGIAEIYKIHGSVDEPDSIIINSDDYKQFDDDAKYLAAKLMTIFMEYPIIFMGYSISDSNIQKILSSIVHCLTCDQLKTLENRFVFIEYDAKETGAVVTPYTIMIDKAQLNLTKIVLSDFSLLYKALRNKKSKLPVRLLRRFKEEIYAHVVTSETTGFLRVAELDDERVKDEDLVISIGKASEFGIRGLSGISSDDWYRNLILGDLQYTADELLDYSFENLNKQNSNKLPFYKFLVNAKKDHPYAIAQTKTQTFDEIISASLRKNRKSLGDYHSIKGIWDNESKDVWKATWLMALLKEDQIDVDELEMVLKSLFGEDANYLLHCKTNVKSNIKRLIKIYDCLKYGEIWKTKRAL